MDIFGRLAGVTESDRAWSVEVGGSNLEIFPVAQRRGNAAEEALGCLFSPMMILFIVTHKCANLQNRSFFDQVGVESHRCTFDHRISSVCRLVALKETHRGGSRSGTSIYLFLMRTHA